MKPLYLVVLSVLFAFISCKPKTREELIVGTWKVDIEATKKATPPGKPAPVRGEQDEMKITFYKDMTTQMSRKGMDGGQQEQKSGTYKLVHDGKYLDIMEQGRDKTEEAEIVELTNNIMRIRIPDSTVIVFAKSQ